MKIAYYPGCTLKTRAKNLEESAIEALKTLNVELEELDRWNCCGAVYSLSDDDLIHLVAPVRDLIRVKEQGYDRVITICSMCYNTLARANRLMRTDEVKRKTLNDFMEEEIDYEGDVEVIHLLQFLRDDIGWEALKAAVKVPLDGLRLSPYYGCTLTRPTDVTIDGGVHPTIFREFVEALGATFVDFDYAAECCGSYQMISNPDAAIDTAAKIIQSAENQDAEALILSCPLCDYNLSKRQVEIINKHGELKPLPIFYFTQLLAVALGVDPTHCRFELNPADVPVLLEEKGFLRKTTA